MALKIIHGHTCDDCAADDPEVPAPHSYVLSINGAPFKQLDFCAPSDRAVMRRLVELYEERGHEPPELKQPKPEPEPEAKAATTQRKPKELERAPKQKPSASKSKGPQIWCPLEHGPEGTGKFVVYKSRVPHAETHGLHVWDIAWKDVHGILEAPCTAHQKCMDTGLMFLNQQGVYTHINKCPLPRIDTGTPSVDNEGSSE